MSKNPHIQLTSDEFRMYCEAHSLARLFFEMVQAAYPGLRTDDGTCPVCYMAIADDGSGHDATCAFVRARAMFEETT